MKVGICGATGYSGREIVRILLRHPHVSIQFVTSEQFAGQPLAGVFPEFRSRTGLVCRAVDTLSEDEDIDLVFLALPHGVSMKTAGKFLNRGVKVIDLSGDFRLPAREYEKWYKSPHSDPGNLSKAVYGLTEFFREEIRKAQLVSNPGCYPTGACLGLVPALHAGIISLDGIAIDSKSGASGAGRGPAPAMQFCEVYENMKAYKIGVHQHTPEIESVLNRFSDRGVVVTFVPHLVPIDRGILSTIYVRLKERMETRELVRHYEKFYEKEPFVRVLPEGTYPLTRSVEGANFCDIGIKADERSGLAVIVTAIDNIVKGAAGQAVQNMNVLAGFDETAALW